MASVVVGFYVITSVEALILFLCMLDCELVSEVGLDDSKLSFRGFRPRALAATESLLSEEDELEGTSLA